MTAAVLSPALPPRSVALPRLPRGAAALASAVWVAAAFACSYPSLMEEIGQARYMREAARLAQPMVPVQCHDARGQENREFVREDRNPEKCWMDLASFRRLYPDVAETMDERASSRLVTAAGLPVEQWEGSPEREIAKTLLLVLLGPAVALALAPLSRRRAPPAAPART